MSHGASFQFIQQNFLTMRKPTVCVACHGCLRSIFELCGRGSRLTIRMIIYLGGGKKIFLPLRNSSLLSVNQFTKPSCLTLITQPGGYYCPLLIDEKSESQRLHAQLAIFIGF